MSKSADAFRTISEVAEWLETPAHVLRFWESKFSQVKPVKRAGGRRYYRPADMLLLGGIKKLLHEDGMTIKGVQKMLREQGIKQVAALSQPLDDGMDPYASRMAEDVEPDDITATVLSFQRGDAAPDAAEKPPAPDNAHDTVEPMVFRHAPTGQPGESVNPDTAEPETAAPPDVTAPDAPPKDPEDQPAASPSSDTAPLPGFLQAPVQEATQAGITTEADAAADEQATATETPQGAAAPPAPLAVTVPDDPQDDIAAEPGVLSALAARQGIPASLAPRLADLVARLRALHG